MDRDDVRLLFEYDRWANGRVLQAAGALSEEQFTRDLGGSFRSVRDTLLHIVSGEWGWLTYWKEPRADANFLKDLWDRHDKMFKPEAFGSADAVRVKLAEIEREQMEFLDALTEDALKKMLPVRGTQLSLEHLMQHLANHSSYHRGQVATMMRQVGGKPVATDFHAFLIERSLRKTKNDCELE